MNKREDARAYQQAFSMPSFSRSACRRTGTQSDLRRNLVRQPQLVAVAIWYNCTAFNR